MLVGIFSLLRSQLRVVGVKPETGASAFQAGC